MSLKIHYKKLLTDIITLICFFEVMFFQWLGLDIICGYVLIGGIILEIMLNLQFFLNCKATYFAIGTIIIYPLLSLIVLKGRYTMAFGNILRIAPSIMVFLHICFLCCVDNYRTNLRIKKLFVPLNLYFLINIPFIYLQSLGHTELVCANHEIVTNQYLPDLISGLFGYNGTPMMAMYVASLISFNLMYFKKYLHNKHVFSFLFYTFILLLYVLYISVISENKAMILVVILCVFVYYVSANDISQKIRILLNKMLKLIVMILCVFIIGYMLYLSSASFRESIDGIFNVIEKIGVSEPDVSLGSSERLVMIFYFFTYTNSILMGNGLGNNYWTQNNAFGFKHFGQSDLGVFLIIGGVLFLFLIMLYLKSVLKTIFKKTSIEIVLCLFLVFLMMYTQMFTVTSLMISYSLFIVICWHSRLIQNKKHFRVK